MTPTPRRSPAKRLVFLALLVGAAGAVAETRRRATTANRAELHARYGPDPSA